jgi:hypothetical protein
MLIICLSLRRKLSDVDGDNRLTLAEFSVAMHIIMKVCFLLNAYAFFDHISLQHVSPLEKAS